MHGGDETSSKRSKSTAFCDDRKIIPPSNFRLYLSCTRESYDIKGIPYTGFDIVKRIDHSLYYRLSKSGSTVTHDVGKSTAQEIVDKLSHLSMSEEIIVHSSNIRSIEL